MSLDRLQSKPGFLYIQAEPSYTVASSLSSAASNQLPGGYQFGSQFAICPASSNVSGGGGLVMKAITNQTYAASSGTGAMVSHDGVGIIFASLSSGGGHNLQPPAFHGQLLKIVNIAPYSASILSTAVLSGQGSGSTTTATIPTLTGAVTIGGSSGSNCIREFIGMSNYGSSNSNSTYALWSCIGGAGVAFESSAPLAVRYVSGQTYAASSGTGAMVTHNNAPVVWAQVSSGGVHNLQPPSYDGQLLTLYNASTVSCSFVSTAVVNGQGAGSTTTINAPTLTNAFTMTSGVAASKVLMGFTSLGGTATNSVVAAWSVINV